jgi:annexin A7/11
MGQYGQQQNVIYYLNTPIPPPGGPPASQGLPGYDDNRDVRQLRDAMKGVGTKEALLIQTLTPLSAMQLAVLAATYRASIGKELLADIDSEANGKLKDVLTALVRGPIGYDVKLLHQALSGAGTDEHLLTEIIADRTPSDLYQLSLAYRTRYGRSLEEAVRGDLSGKTERIYTMVLSSNRPPDNTPVDPGLVEADVKALYKAGQGKVGTDEVASFVVRLGATGNNTFSSQIAFCNIIINRTRPHLTALWEAYQRQHGKTLSKVIKSEFSDHMKTTLLYIVTAANPKRVNEGPGVWRDVKLLEATMKGMGTKDNLLIRRLIRTHWDQSYFAQVKRVYERKYKKSLESRVAGETSGDYKKACVGIIRGV